MRKRTSIILAALGVLSAAARAHAVPPEYLVGLALHPLDPNTFVLRYESAGGGFLFTRDGGKSVTSNPARSFIKYGLTGEVPFAIGSDGKLLLGQIDGLYSDDGGGCLGAAPTLAAWVAGFAPHPSDPDVLFLVTTGNTKTLHAGLWKRDRAGALTSFGVSDPLVPEANTYRGLVVYGFKVVARSESSQGLRFVQTAIRYTIQDAHMVPSPLLRFSDDLGATWTERALPDTGATKGTPRLMAAGSATPMKVIVAMEVTGPEPDPPDPILYSPDEGQTFAPYISEITKASASLLLPDGRFLVGERASAGGLWTADSLGATPRKVATFPVHCLGYHAKSQRTYMCKPHEFGLLDLDAWSFCSQFQMNEVRSFACATFNADQLATVQMQLCGGFCGPGHYASAQLCARYDDPAQVCGVQARAYDMSNPDPEKRWIEPPGLGAAPRCAGSAPPPPPPVVVAAADAGAVLNPPRSADAGVGAGNAGTNPIRAGDGGAAGTIVVGPQSVPTYPGGTAGAQTETDSDAVSDSDEEAPASGGRTRGGGCQVRVEAAPMPWPAWLLIGALVARRGRRSRKAS